MIGWKSSRRKKPQRGLFGIFQASSPADTKQTDVTARNAKTMPMARGSRAQVPRSAKAVRPKGSSQAATAHKAALRRQADVKAKLESAQRMQRLGRKVSSGYIKRLDRELKMANRAVASTATAAGNLWKR